MTERLLTPSKITAWLDCEHYLTLKHLEESGEAPFERSHPGAFARLLMEKGDAHERACLQEYRDRGLSVLEIPRRAPRESFGDWVARIGNPLAERYEVIFQMPFVHGGVRGIADFLVPADDPETGEFTYEPVDSKLARTEAKPGHVLQLCFYAEAIEGLTKRTPERLHVWLGSGRFETVHHADVRPYWNRLRGQLSDLMNAPAAAAETRPVPCAHCDFCEFANVCDERWRADDSLIYLAGLRDQERTVLEAADVATLTALASQDDRVPDLQPDRFDRLARQANLQVEARADPEAKPPFELVPPGDDPIWGHGFDLMPAPDDSDLFLDFEGHPFWRADSGLFFLFGYVAQEPSRGWVYTALWAHDRAGEAKATEALVRALAQRRASHPAMHVYHYNHTERSALVQLATTHGVAEAKLDELIQTGLFVDLYTVVRNAVQVGTESYGLKHLERLAGYQRSHVISQGAGAVVAYEAFMSDSDPARLAEIARYNEDDVRSTRALRDWLVAQRPADLGWRAPRLAVDDTTPELDETVDALHAFGPETPQHLLGDMLGYWMRERRANLAPKLGKLDQDMPSLLDDADAIVGLVPRGMFTPPRARVPRMRFAFPPQEIDEARFNSSRGSVIYSAGDGLCGYAGVASVDSDEGTLDLMWNDAAQELGTLPPAVVRDDWVRPTPKPGALALLADRILDPTTHGSPNPVQMALLRRDLPAFEAGEGPADGLFDDDLDRMMRLVCNLDGSTLAVQGPPGTGKTYRGAHMVQALILDGKRVGITAMSHKAIENLVNAVVGVMTASGEIDRLNGIQRVPDPTAPAPIGIRYSKRNKECAGTDFNLVAGTSWLFAGTDMRQGPVDVLLIDEAGQFALVDALAAASSAHNLVLLGDPLQLAQVTQASHPRGAGLSVIDHVLGDSVTMPAERGVFLDVTRRMHPDVCAFISERIYEGRLTSFESCGVQDTDWGTGLRWLRAHHTGRSTEAPEEAEAVAETIAELLGGMWVDEAGARSAIQAEHIMVVAPYNDQVDLIRTRLDQSPEMAGVEVGTVDKFQGREAPVVFFTMTTSTATDMPRGSDFLFSRHRTNVAISRARCLAILVSTKEILDTRARTVDEMRLLSTLCAFVEAARDWATH